VPGGRVRTLGGVEMALAAFALAGYSRRVQIVV
jgi:hypothetical protein